MRGKREKGRACREEKKKRNRKSHPCMYHCLYSSFVMNSKPYILFVIDNDEKRVFFVRGKTVGNFVGLSIDLAKLMLTPVSAPRR